MIILCGIKHCGKSTIGKNLAEKLNFTFVDVDEEIEKIAGKSCRDLYLQDVKEAFMKAEAKACKNIEENPLYENAVV
ncbi:MAG: AAA family ATPase, partial [Spirochaetaceae bacterium]|nr:AAA family ATPase [Spirochaetaceae bacterium]